MGLFDFGTKKSTGPEAVSSASSSFSKGGASIDPKDPEKGAKKIVKMIDAELAAGKDFHATTGAASTMEEDRKAKEKEQKEKDERDKKSLDFVKEQRSLSTNDKLNRRREEVAKILLKAEVKYKGEKLPGILLWLAEGRVNLQQAPVYFGQAEGLAFSCYDRVVESVSSIEAIEKEILSIEKLKVNLHETLSNAGVDSESFIRNFDRQFTSVISEMELDQVKKSVSDLEGYVSMVSHFLSIRKQGMDFMFANGDVSSSAEASAFKAEIDETIDLGMLDSKIIDQQNLMLTALKMAKKSSKAHKNALALNKILDGL